MFQVKAKYIDTNVKFAQPLPIKEDYEIIVTFVEPLKKDKVNIMDFFNCWNGEQLLDIEQIMADRDNSSLGRPEI